MSGELKLPSNRSFGTLFVVVFGLLGAYAWWRSSSAWPWLLGSCVATAFATLAFPAVLTPFNRAWMRLAVLLNRIVSPIVLGGMFFVVFTPVAIFMRLIGRDAMNRRWDPNAASYWIDRQPPGPDPKSLPNQF